MPPGFDPSAASAFAPDVSLLELAVYAVAILFGMLFLLTMLAVFSLPIFFAALLGLEGGLRAAQTAPDPVGKWSKLGGLAFRNLRRNLVRTALSYVALFVLTGMLTLIYSIVSFLGVITQEKENNVQVIMTEKFNIPSMMPRGYATRLQAILENDLDPPFRPNPVKDNFMTWSFVGGTLDPAKRTQENSLFLFALEPDTLLTMMNDQGLTPADMSEEGYNELLRGVDLVKQDKRNCIIGYDRLKIMGKRVGDDIKLYSIMYPNVTFDLKIVAAFPADSRYGQSAAMRRDYFFSTIDDALKPGGVGANNPSAYERHVNLVWVRLPTKAAYEQLAAIVNDPKTFSGPAVKLETASAGISSFLDAYKDIFWGMKYIIMPAIMVIMCLVVGITITIGVRERWAEMAVMKVLGFQPSHVVAMIVGESVLIGVFGGMLSTWAVYFLPLLVKSSGVKFQIAFFTNFKAPWEIVIYGPVLGVLVGLIGAAVPAWSARRVKVSEVFARVA